MCRIISVLVFTCVASDGEMLSVEKSALASFTVIADSTMCY